MARASYGAGSWRRAVSDSTITSVAAAGMGVRGSIRKQTRCGIHWRALHPGHVQQQRDAAGAEQPPRIEEHIGPREAVSRGEDGAAEHQEPHLGHGLQHPVEEAFRASHAAEVGHVEHHHRRPPTREEGGVAGGVEAQRSVGERASDRACGNRVS